MSGVIDFIGGPFVIISIAKVLVAFVALLLTTLIVIWAERRILADMQSRVGPNRHGPQGLLQTLADGIKLFFKEDFRPSTADKWTYAIAPLASMVPSFLAFAVIPFGDRVNRERGSRRTEPPSAPTGDSRTFQVRGVHAQRAAGHEPGERR